MQFQVAQGPNLGTRETYNSRTKGLGKIHIYDVSICTQQKNGTRKR